MKDLYLLKDGAELVIRKGVANDSNNLIEYVKMYSLPTDFLTKNQCELIKNIDAQRSVMRGFLLDSSNELFLIAEVGRRIIGYLIFRLRNKPTIIHVGEAFISVAPDYKEFGVNKLLMNHLLFWAKDIGFIRKINLKIPLDNKSDIEVFKEMSFKSEGILRREFYNEGILSDALIMGICVESNTDVVGAGLAKS